MEPIALTEAWTFALALAFVLGFAARQAGLPPLIGFLVAGFVLNGLGVTKSEVIDLVANLGVTLLLFTIGLKLKLKSLARPEVWGVSALHALMTSVTFGMFVLALGATGLGAFAGLDTPTAFLLAFALSFSSTVFAVKVLEEKGEMATLHGRTAIGILIMQDVFAVVFLTASTGKLPSVWAISLVALIAVRPLLVFMLRRVGHGELLPLFGLFAALALGVEWFQAVGLKPDLGALVFGMLLANEKKAAEVADQLFGFKELLLVGFFVNIGLAELPGLENVLIALLLLLLIPLKAGLFFFLLTRFSLRGRTAALSALVLANYSEFGLIVSGIGVALGVLAPSWLVTIAIALSLSFVIGAPLNRMAHTLCGRWQARLAAAETPRRHPEEADLDTGDAEVAIFGMGRIGTGAYDHLRETMTAQIIGIEALPDKVAGHCAEGRHVITADATDPGFWQRCRKSRVRLVLLAMPEHHANLYALEQLRAQGFSGFVAALAQYPDRAEQLIAAGADVAFNSYESAGAGFAAHVEEQLRENGGLEPARG